MNISKKEISIFIEIVFSVLFAIFFLPYFYDNRFEIYDLDTSMIKLVEIIVFSIIYFSLAYTLLEIFIRKKVIKKNNGLISININTLKTLTPLKIYLFELLHPFELIQQN